MRRLDSGNPDAPGLTLVAGGANLAVRYEYLDVKSFARLRSDSTRTVRGRPVRIQTIFGDYRKTRGVLFPRSIEVAVAGRPQRVRITLETIEVNPPLSDTIFEVPAALAP